jgi:hypothetical protein
MPQTEVSCHDEVSVYFHPTSLVGSFAVPFAMRVPPLQAFPYTRYFCAQTQQERDVG